MKFASESFCAHLLTSGKVLAELAGNPAIRFSNRDFPTRQKGKLPSLARLLFVKDAVLRIKPLLARENLDIARARAESLIDRKRVRVSFVKQSLFTMKVIGDSALENVKKLELFARLARFARPRSTLDLTEQIENIVPNNAAVQFTSGTVQPVKNFFASVLASWTDKTFFAVFPVGVDIQEKPNPSAMFD